MNKLTQLALVLVLGLASASYAAGDLAAEVAALKAQMKTQQSELQQLRAASNDSWLTQRRAEEVKGLIRDVLSDANTRASLAEGGMMAGYNGQHFYLANDTGSFLMQVSGELQFRYVANFLRTNLTGSPGGTSADQSTYGFEMSRAKIQFDGHVGDPNIGYLVRLAADRYYGYVAAEEAWVSYKPMDNVTVYAGRKKSPFLHEELVANYNQLAVERSLVNEYFTLGYTEGLYADWNVSDMVHTSFAFTDGRGSGETGVISGGNSWISQRNDVAVSARADVKLDGEWAQNDDFTAWQGDPNALFVGAAVQYERGRQGDSQVAVSYDNSVSWTVDATWKSQGFSLYAAGMGLHDQGARGVIASPDELTQDSIGAVVQAGYMLTEKLQPFVRYEYLKIDQQLISTDYDSNINIITVGANYYLHKQAAKFTMDVVWALNGLPSSYQNLGLQEDAAGKANQVALRAQFQLLF